LRYRVALLLLSDRNKEALETWILQLLRLNVEPGHPHGHLSEEQRTRLATGVWAANPSPSKELAGSLLGVEE